MHFTNKNGTMALVKRFTKTNREVYNMSIVALLIGLGPLIGWGFFPTVASKFGGKPVHQIIGATVGTLIFAIILAVVTSSGFPTGTNTIRLIIRCRMGIRTNHYI